MYFIRSEHFTGVLLFVYIFCYTSTRFNLLTYAASLNTSEEIKHIFNDGHSFKDTNVTYAKGVPKSGNFAEGGLLNINISPIRKNDTSLINSTHVSKPNASEIVEGSFKNSNIMKSKNSTLYKHPTTKTSLLAKLNDTGSNLFLGVPEVIHVNGTSSIKPRKGVYYNKIVPRKGVENDNGADNNSDSLCIWLGENQCYNSKELNDVDCKCCNHSNALGKTIRENYHVSCKNCKPVIPELPDDKHICENICCYYKFNKTVLDSNTQDINYKNESFTSISKKDNSSNNDEIKKLSSHGVIANLTKSSRHKPNITKVPYDAEVVTEILSKTKQKVFVPVIVSLLLLPLIGILVFVVLRKMKEIWDKRYYKRMDFLIDGMYQD